MSCFKIASDKANLPPTIEWCRREPLTKAALLVISLLSLGVFLALHFTRFSSSYTIAFGALSGATFLGLLGLCLATCRFTEEQFIDSLCRQNKNEINRLAALMQEWSKDFVNPASDRHSEFLAGKILEHLYWQRADEKEARIPFHLAVFKACLLISQEETTPAIFGIKVIEAMTLENFPQELKQWLGAFFKENPSAYLFCKPSEQERIWDVQLNSLFSKRDTDLKSQTNDVLLAFVIEEIERIGVLNIGDSLEFSDVEVQLAVTIWEKIKNYLPSNYRAVVTSNQGLKLIVIIEPAQ